MNLYFSCSITGGRSDEAVYRQIVSALLAAGHQVPTAHLASPEVQALEGDIDPQRIFERDIAWIDGCQAMVAEISTPSHGVGYEIAYALQQGKPVVCLFQQGRRVSKMLTGNTHPALRVLSYSNPGEAIEQVFKALANL